MKLLWLLTAFLSFLTADLQAVFAAEKPPSSRDRFHLYLLIGQSNMAGRGALDESRPSPPARIFKFNREGQWEPATEPLHFDNPRIAGAGLGLSFAEAMRDSDPDVTIGLIPCAVGGTPLSRWQKGGDLYQQALDRARQAMRDGTLRGILWHQGEQDALDQGLAESYGQRLAEMVRDLRADLNAPDVPFTAGELGHFLADSSQERQTFPRVINAQLHAAKESIPRFAVVSAANLTSAKDKVHFDTPALREFGRRYAAAMQQLQESSVSKNREIQR
jgi:hypothetical protein